MSDKGQKILYWLPRVVGIFCAIICFILAFGVFFEDDWTPVEQTIGFFIQLIPFLIMSILLYIAWKWEFIGGINYIILGIVVIAFTILSRPERLYNSFFLSGPLFFTGLLFIIHYFIFEKKI